MKNRKCMLLILLGLALGLSACKKKPEAIKPPVVDELTGEGDPDEEKNYIEATIDTIAKDEEKDYIKILEFTREKNDKLDDLSQDMIFLKLEDILSGRISTVTKDLKSLDLENELLIEEGLFFKEEDIGKIKNKDLKAYMEDLYASDYKLISLEGDYYPVVDYDKLLVDFQGASDEIKDYIILMAEETNEPSAIDGGISISFQELARRIIARENYIRKYSSSNRFDEMLRAYKNDLFLYLNGLDNTPIYDLETGIIYDEVFKSYRSTANTRDTSTGLIIQKYLKAIEENDKIIDSKIEELSISLLGEAIHLLGAGK